MKCSELHTEDQWVTTSSISCLQVEGSELKKIRTNSRVYQRYYLLDTGLQALCWEPSKKESDKARISLASIREVSDQRKSFLYQPCMDDLIDSFKLRAMEIFTTFVVFIVSDVDLYISCGLKL